MVNHLNTLQPNRYTASPSKAAWQPTNVAAKPHRKLRVLTIITRLTIGGDTNVVLDIVDYLNRHPDFEVHLAVGPVPANEVDLTHWAYERSIPTTVIPHLLNHISPLTNLSAVVELRKLIKQGKYDIVHTHSSVAGVVGRLAARSMQVPIIVHHVHGWGLRPDMSKAVRMLYLSMERLCARFTDRMIAVSRPTIYKGLAHHIGRAGKFSLIYNGIQLEKFRQPVDEQQMRLALGLDPTCKLVGMIGRLDKQKNPLDFIQAAALVVQAYPHVQFLIAGEGSLRPECEQLIRELQLEGKFFLLGFRKDIEYIVPLLTVTAMSSLWEGLPVVFQEVMSAGKPIVANNVDGASDVVIEGETGFLVTPHRPQEMAERILRLLTDEKLCHQQGLNARQYSEQFSGQQMLEKLEALYRELAANCYLDA